ncbi:sucrase ferredoxin [Nostoc sp. 'Peltigera malacea cyanobiont' DB3992]|uniref:sucrase ferredoxin n=1 Tax=Nostoc sp. 'Peltigera malacea cyanobiont' DB3992 TaxID=1206980 RepID=UPI000C03C7B0|nr:sucrase ferredoxin [Nostoc sp. 'Peltigera malacea cyanobiont' DB3992]PHM11850.1 sucrase ferredoxin [Nostoc sp. 'Peltigera malacea cyanobiont' DB3992]
MDNSFCALESRDVGEDPIANAYNFDFFVMIECPTPWIDETFNSKSVPENLRNLVKEFAEYEIAVEFLLIYNKELQQPDTTRILIFSRPTGFAQAYSKYEFLLSDITEAATIIKKCLLEKNLDACIDESNPRDIFICTHGSRDKCCAKFGNPFYRQAKNIVKDLGMNNVRIWQCTHFGGHRFAPTAIDFPEARYYARLDSESFSSILTRTGNLEFIKHIYRGWAILPEAAQVLEREMILIHGWQWLSYKVDYQIIQQTENGEFNRIKLNFIKPDGSLGSVKADVLIDQAKTLYLSDCQGEIVETIPQFSIKNLLADVQE